MAHHIYILSHVSRTNGKPAMGLAWTFAMSNKATLREIVENTAAHLMTPGSSFFAWKDNACHLDSFLLAWFAAYACAPWRLVASTAADMPRTTMFLRLLATFTTSTAQHPTLLRDHMWGHIYNHRARYTQTKSYAI